MTGYSAPYGNNADMRTRGFEVSLGWTRQFPYGEQTPSATACALALGQQVDHHQIHQQSRNTLPTLYANAYYEGMELGENLGLPRRRGFFATDEEAQEWGSQGTGEDLLGGDNKSWNAGDLKFADLDESGVVDNGSNRLDDHGDLRKIGNSSPRYHYGINFSANWNGIDFAVLPGRRQTRLVSRRRVGALLGNKPPCLRIQPAVAERRPLVGGHPSILAPPGGAGRQRAAARRQRPPAESALLPPEKHLAGLHPAPADHPQGPHRETAHLRLGEKTCSSGRR